MPRPATLQVTAAHADRPCPKIRTRAGPIDKETGRDRSMIYHDEVIEVPNVRYYRRRIIKNDLVEAQPAAKPKTKSKAKTKTEAEE